MNLELVRVPTARPFDVTLLDYEPRRARDVALVVGHGYSSSKHNLDAMCAFLASHGYRVLSLDFPGHKLGATAGRLDHPDDLVAAMNAGLARARATGARTIYTVGHSMGAQTALRTCALDAAVTGAISIATGYGRPRALAALGLRGTVDLRAAYVDGLSLPELVEQTEPLLAAALPLLAGRPVLYVAADRDAMVSPASARELFDRAPEPKTFATITSDHTSAGENARAAIIAWLGGRHPR